MGCDVHAHIEAKLDGAWEHYSIPNIPRNYELFGLMAGVRDCDITPIDKPRGVPKDITNVTAIDLDFWGDDAHTLSWLNINEIAFVEKYVDSIVKVRPPILGYLFNNRFSDFIEYREDFPHKLEDVRMVFWFDN